jgi:type II secretory pathway predicted ATPase ExeA
MVPFSLTPDPALLHVTPAIRTVLFKARYVVDNKQGLTCIMGDVGLGKSTVLRYLHGQIASNEDYETAFIPSPNYSSDFALLKGICQDFGVPPKRSMLAQENELRVKLIELHDQGKTAVVFLDEAQRLPGKQMELIRTLMNFETNKAKLIQIILAAQLELQNKLRDPSKKAIRSRIFLPSILSALSLPEAIQMIQFRCDQSQVKNPFDEEAVKAIYDCSQGVPRDILKIASAAYAIMKGSGQDKVPAEAIPEISKEAMIYEQ